MTGGPATTRPEARTRPRTGRRNSWFGCGLVVAMTVLGVGVLLANELFLHGPDSLTASERRAENLIQGPTPDTVEAAVKPVRADHTYVDPLLEDVAAKGLRDGSVRDRIDELGIPVYIAQLPMFYDDGSGGDEAIAVEQLANAVGRDGVYVVVNERNDGVASTARGDYPSLLTGTSLNAALDSLAEEQRRFEKEHGITAQIRDGIFVGGALAAVLCLLMYVAWRLLRARGRAVGGFE